MKKNILQLLMTFLLFISVNATAQNCCLDNYSALETNVYAKILGGANFLQKNNSHSTFKTGYLVAGSVGYSSCYGLSIEGEYAFRKNTIKKISFAGEGSSNHGYFQTSSYMANLLWDVPCILWNIEPFIGAGIGYDSQRLHSSNSLVVFNQKWNRFSWQLMIGLSYLVLCNTEMTLEYKFHQASPHLNNHSVGIGLLYRFGRL